MSEKSNDLASEIICDCTGTTYRKVQTLYEAGFDLDAICRKTGARSGCGGCEWEIEEFVQVISNLDKNE